jgi:hypothetical protein
LTCQPFEILITATLPPNHETAVNVNSSWGFEVSTDTMLDDVVVGGGSEDQEGGGHDRALVSSYLPEYHPGVRRVSLKYQLSTT